MYKVIIKSFLDYEFRYVYNVIIQCQDQGIFQYQNTFSFFINVLDVNDNNLVFLQFIYRVIIKENNFLNEVIIIVKVVDKDSGFVGKVIYFMYIDGSDSFYVDLILGVIIVKKLLDREMLFVILFYVNVFDVGNFQLKFFIFIRFILEDENDNILMFKKFYFEFYVLEE